MQARSRPLSPHIQIYKPQVTSVLSVTHRATGIALAVGTLLFVWWLAAAAAGPESYESAQNFMGSWFGMLLLFGWSLCLFYHLCNGIRHLFWDAGYGYELPDAYRSGQAVLVGAVILTVLTWIVALAVGG